MSTSTSTTTIDDLHSDLVNRALRLMDGPTLAAVSSSSSRLRSLSSNPAIWRSLCLSTWPSLNHPTLLSLLSNHHRSFFSQSYPLPLLTTHDEEEDDDDHNAPSLPTQLISALDLYHEGTPVFSRVIDTDTSSSWFLDSPFQLDGLDRKDHPDPYNFTEPAINPDRLTLSWAVIDPCTARAVNISSRRPVSVDRHWFTGEIMVRFALILRRCAVTVQVTCGEESGQVRQVRLTVEDMDGKWVNGKGSLGILAMAMEGERRAAAAAKVEERYEEYLRRKRERREKKTSRDGLLDLLCTGKKPLLFPQTLTPEMENIALLSSKFGIPFVPTIANSDVLNSRWQCSPFLRGGSGARMRQRRCAVSAVRGDGEDEGSKVGSKRVLKKMDVYDFARISTSNSSEMSTASATPQLPGPPPPSYIGSPLFWIGVGVGISALFSVVATKVKQYALQQAFKTMMSQPAPQNGQFSNSAFPQGPPFPFPPMSPSVSSTPSQRHVYSQPTVTMDAPATRVEATPPTEISNEQELKVEPKKYAFVDVSPEEVLQEDPGLSQESTVTNTSSTNSEAEVSSNGAAFKQDATFSSEQSQSSKQPSVLSVEALEKMMEDPTVQKMVYPYLPEEMRNPTTFKWMLQNPQYRQQLQDMLSNMGGSGEWDNQMMDSLKNFDLSSPEVKQQFDQIGLTPEEVISKIMANPEVALAFQNPKVQAAIMDCSQNPLSIAKYQNDKEVMDVFTRISELFPGVTGY